MSSSPFPLLSPQEEFDSLHTRCRSMEDLALLEGILFEGVSRVARSLAQETVRCRAELPESSSPKEAFPPSG